MNANHITALLKVRSQLLSLRDLEHNSDTSPIDDMLRQIPEGENNDVDLALGRRCAVLPTRGAGRDRASVSDSTGEGEMKYLVNHRVINADQIRQVQYMEADETFGDTSACFIDLGCNTGDRDWDVSLRGQEADRFWEAYISDAYAVVNPK